jgi:hypothetical protein
MRHHIKKLKFCFASNYTFQKFIIYILLEIWQSLKGLSREIGFKSFDKIDVDAQSFAPIGLHKTDAASDWLLKKRHCIGGKACRDSNYKINRIT